MSLCLPSCFPWRSCIRLRLKGSRALDVCVMLPHDALLKILARLGAEDRIIMCAALPEESLPLSAVDVGMAMIASARRSGVLKANDKVTRFLCDNEEHPSASALIDAMDADKVEIARLEKASVPLSSAAA